jgi:hypothetical protein
MVYSGFGASSLDLRLWRPSAPTQQVFPSGFLVGALQARGGFAGARLGGDNARSIEAAQKPLLGSTSCHGWNGREIMVLPSLSRESDLVIHQ